MFRRVLRVLWPVCLLTLGLSQGHVQACPFCSATSQTLSEEIKSADAVVLAKLEFGKGSSTSDPDRTSGFSISHPETGKARFKIIDIIKGKEHITAKDRIEVIFFGTGQPETTFLISGLGEPNLEWTTPLPLSKAAVGYIKQLSDQSDPGSDRLAFFQEYLQHEDPMLAQDAYDEFARAPYEDVMGLKDRMDHEQLVTWVKDLEIPPSRRRLYLTMLGVCGNQSDLPMLEEMIRSKDRKVKMGLDAMIGCYLTLKGPAGMPLVEDLFLKNHDSAYQDTYAAIMALRFHGQESRAIPRARVIEALRHLLDHPELADQIIPDLARWQDWSVIDKLVELFKTSDEKSRWVRIPVINYLRTCSKQDNELGKKALAAIDELAEIDPESVERANSFFAFGALAGATSTKSKSDTGSKTPPAADGEGKTLKTASNPADPASADKKSADQTNTDQDDQALDTSDETAAKEYDFRVTLDTNTDQTSSITDTEPQAEDRGPKSATESASSEKSGSAIAASHPQEAATDSADKSQKSGEGVPSTDGSRSADASSPDRVTAEMTAQTSGDEVVPSRLMIIGTLLVFGVGLSMLIWTILRRGSDPTAS